MQWVRLRFQVALSVLFGAMIAGAALGMMLVQIEGSQKIIGESALAYMDVVGDRASDQVTALLDPVANALRVLAKNSALLESTAPSDADIVPGLMESLGQLGGLCGLLIGYDDGNYLYLESFVAIPIPLRETQHEPQGTVYRLTEIRLEGGQRIMRVRWLDARGHQLGNVVATSKPPFDPRRRPWYRNLAPGATIAVSKPYVFFTLKVPGYTVSVPLAGKVHGVLAADILLSSLDNFLMAQRVSPNGRVVLFEDSGAVASAGGLSELLRKRARVKGTDELALPPLNVLEYPALDAAVAQWDGQSLAHETVAVADQIYIASIRPVASTLVHGVNVITIAPLDEFFGPIERLRDRVLFYALAIAVVAIALTLIVARRVASQLILVAGEAGKIRRLELDPTPLIHSRLTEIDQLADAVARAKSAVRDFARFVPRGLVGQLIESGTSLELGGERREATILFTDAVGFTALSERADPVRLMHNSSRYLATLSAAIAERGGTIDKFIGDSVMAFWNAPSPDPDHVVHGCEAILACRHANQSLNRHFAAEGWPSMQTRYGLHVGEVIVGIVGSEDRLNYTAVGAAVNLAARLEGLNAHYGSDVLVSDAVVARARHAFLFRRIDVVRPKGLAQPLTVYSLVAAKLPDGSGLDKALVERLELWEQIIADWDEYNWAKALRGVESYLKLDPTDHAARIYRDRCTSYLRDRVGTPYDLITNHEQK